MKKYLPLFKQTFKEFGEDKAPRLGAALAYYTVFSIAPLLLIAIAIAGLVFGQEAARNEISGQLGGLMGPSTAKALEDMVQAAAKPKSGVMATIIGIITLMFGASGVFAQLNDALDTIWNVEKQKKGGIVATIKDRFLSMAMVCGIGFLLLVSLVFDAAISAMGKYFGNRFPGGEALLQAGQLIVSFALVTVLFAAIFKFLPDIKVAWRDVWLGAVFTSILFVVGKFALGLYIGKAAASSTYGAAGSLVVLLLWVYWSAQILFLGAEFTQVYARTLGSLKGDTSKQEAKAEAGRVEDRPKDAAPHGRPAAAPMSAPMYAKQKSGGGFVKILIGGVAGLVFGAILGGISTLSMILKSVRKLIPIR
jgi:membrane protein